MLRDFEIIDCRIAYYKLVPFKNHTRKQYRRKYVASLFCDWCAVKQILGWIYIKTGFYIKD